MGNASQGGSGNGNTGVFTGAAGLQSGSPVKESSFLNRETSAEELEKGEGLEKKDSMSPPPVKGGIPIRR